MQAIIQSEDLAQMVTSEVHTAIASLDGLESQLEWYMGLLNVSVAPRPPLTVQRRKWVRTLRPSRAKTRRCRSKPRTSKRSSPC